MLVAYGPDDHPVIAEETPLDQLQQWSRERRLYCPNCRGVVHVRGGVEKRTQLHFAHQKGECAWSTEAESVRHARGKMVLAQWLREQFPGAVVTLEERLPGPNRIADVFVMHGDGQRWAVEFQCAPLDVEEWRRRHAAYRDARIVDIWVVGNNRLEKQEAFIEAILGGMREVMFLNPLVTPACMWLRWVVTREMVQVWQQEKGWTPALEGWVGRLGYGASLRGQLQDVRLGEQGALIHPARTVLEERTRLLHAMSMAQCVDESVLTAYLRPIVGEEAVRLVVIPLMHAYLRDPDLLRRYNYGRGCVGAPLSEAETYRVQQARVWLDKVAQRGFSARRLQELAQEIPFVGPYASFAGYMEMLAAMH